MRKKSLDEGSGPNWLDTYADMVTLLLTFFVLLFSFSSINASKWEMLVEAFAGQGKTQQQIVLPPNDKIPPGKGLVDPSGGGKVLDEKSAPGKPEEVLEFDDLYYFLKQYVKDKNLQNDVEVVKDENYTFIIFRNNIFFNGNSSVLLDRGKEILDVVCAAFKNIKSQIGVVRFEGHTARAGEAGVPNNTWFDWQLSSNRAVNVLYYIYQKNVLEPYKMTATGHGEHRPLAPHDGTEKTRIKNRRVEIYIGKVGSEPISLDQVYQKINASEKK